MTIRDLAIKTAWKDVEPAIRYHYPTDKNNYLTLYRFLKAIRTRKHKDAREFLELYLCPESKLNEHAYYGIHTNKYSLSFRDWSECANIPIAKTTLERYTPEDILAHFIWEITFYGSEKNMKKVEKVVLDRADKCRKEYEKSSKKVS